MAVRGALPFAPEPDLGLLLRGGEGDAGENNGREGTNLHACEGDQRAVRVRNRHYAGGRAQTCTRVRETRERPQSETDTMRGFLLQPGGSWTAAAALG
eukprot:354898-Chlamydomonas_euryale.AAC.6